MKLKMYQGGVKIDPRGTSFTLSSFLDEVGCEDLLARGAKSQIYREICDVFPVDLDLMLAYESSSASPLDVDRFWPYFYETREKFSLEFEASEFYVYLDTFPDKILLKVDAPFLVQILSFDLFSFEYFVCDVGFTSFLMETKRDMIFASGTFLEYFSDLEKK